MIKQSRRPTFGRAINAAAGALQQFMLQQQTQNAGRLHNNVSDPQAARDDAGNFDGIVFSGNPHETVPRKLLLDDRLSPVERNAWQVFRLLVNTDGVTAFPTYDQLRPYLGSTPGTQASRETVAKALTVLRLTRWLSLGKRVRDSLSGRVQGNVYILHDEPVGCVEAMEIDKDYMQLVGHSLDHANKSVRHVAEYAFKEFMSDPDNELPTRLEVLGARLSGQQNQAVTLANTAVSAEFGIRTQRETVNFSLSSDSELSEKSETALPQSPSSESELSLKQGVSPQVRIPNSYSTYTNTETSVSKSFVPRELNQAGLQIPDSLRRLTPEQQQKALLVIERVQPEIRQAVLNQWHHRVSTGAVKKPFGYLLTCLQLAINGEFNAEWRAPTDTFERDAPNSPASTPVSASAPKVNPRAPYEPKPAQSNSDLAKGQGAMRSIKELINPRSTRQ